MASRKGTRCMTETNAERHARLMLPYPDNLIAEVKATPYPTSDPYLSSVELSVEDLEFGISNLQDRYKEFLILRYRDHLTYRAIGELKGVCVERTRQIIFKDIHTIRHYIKNKLIDGGV